MVGELFNPLTAKWFCLIIFWQQCQISTNLAYQQTSANSFFMLREASVSRRSTKKLFLKISQNSQENTSNEVSYYKKFQACNFIKKKLRHTYFTLFHRTSSDGCFCIYRSQKLTYLHFNMVRLPKLTPCNKTLKHLKHDLP